MELEKKGNCNEPSRSPLLRHRKGSNERFFVGFCRLHKCVFQVFCYILEPLRCNFRAPWGTPLLFPSSHSDCVSCRVQITVYSSWSQNRRSIQKPILMPFCGEEGGRKRPRGHFQAKRCSPCIADKIPLHGHWLKCWMV